MGTSRSVDFFERVVSDEGAVKPQALTDDTDIVGAIIDTQPIGGDGYRSLQAIASLAFTSASGAAGASVTATIVVYHDTESDMSTEVALKTYTYEYTWAADGDNEGVHILPVSLETANRYVRAKFKATEAGTITVDPLVGCMTCSLGGLVSAPDSAYADAGYEATTEPEAA